MASGPADMALNDAPVPIQPVAKMEVDEEQAAAAAEADRKAQAQARLDSLLRKTEQFAHMVGKVKKAAVNATPDSPSKRGGKTRKTEKQEDSEMARAAKQDAEGKGAASFTRLTVQPPSIGKGVGTMRHYQLDALNWLISLHDGNINGILADEMGLGKTLETISLLAYLKHHRKGTKPHLVIVPKSTVGNWLKEIKRWCPSLSAFKLQGSKEDRQLQKLKIPDHDVCVTTYEVCIIEKSTFKKYAWEYIIVDEAHRIKNESSKLSVVLREVNAQHRLLITGTPLQNNLRELWALLNFLKPEMFTSADDFEEWFNIEGSHSDKNSEEEDREVIVQRLHKILRPFLLRRLKADVAKGLPPKVETKLFVGLSAMQRDYYSKMLSRDLEAINANNTNKTRLLNIVMQLRKVCNHPYLFDGAEVGPPYFEGEHLVENSGKMILLDKLLKRLKEQGSRVLIFSQMTRMLDILEDYCRYRGYKYNRIDGSTDQEAREESMTQYNAEGSEQFVFLLSTRAGGLGINLQTADTVVIYDSDWNPQMDLQAQDRAHRIGQKKQVNVFRFVTEETVEEKIIERANKKLFLDAVVIKQGRLMEKNNKLSSNELQSMVRFGAQQIFQSRGGTVTDEDIDAILARGKERTEADTARLQKNQQNNLLNFSLSGDTSSLYEWDGEDYKDKRAAQISGPAGGALAGFIEPPKRERKTNYDVNHYYREALRVGEKKKVEKVFKPTSRSDFQFLDRERLEQIERKQWEANLKLKVLRAQHKVEQRERKRAEAEAEKARRKAERDLLRGGAAAAAALAERQRQEAEKKAAEERRKKEEEEKAAKLKAEKEEEERKEKQRLADEAMAKALAEAETPRLTGRRTSSRTRRPVLKPPTPPAPKSSEEGSSSEEEEEESGDEEEEGDSSEDEGDEMEDDSDDGSEEEDEEEEEEEEEEDEEDEFAGMTPEERVEAELRIAAGMPNKKEMKEKERLEKAGFPEWTRRHFQQFLRASERHGRKAVDAISTSVEGQEPETVKRYHKVFWKKYKDLPDWQRIIGNIEKGEAKLAKLAAYQDHLDGKVEQYDDPYADLEVSYSTAQNKYTVEEDRYIICKLQELGYGEWAALKQAIRTSWQFRFDWFLKSRNLVELQRRGHYLLKQLAREAEEDRAAAAEAAAKRKRKKARSSKKGSKKKASRKPAAKKRASNGRKASNGRRTSKSKTPAASRSRSNSKKGSTKKDSKRKSSTSKKAAAPKRRKSRR